VHVQPCPDNTVTPDQFATNAGTPPFTSPDACVTRCVAKPGYGWADSTAAVCLVGYYKPGYNNMACSACGAGLTTLATMSASPDDCVPLPGWEKQQATDDFAAPCVVGAWSAGLVAGAQCRACADGSSTEYPMSNDPSQCTVCSPGYGANPAYQSAANPLCVRCSPGFFSPGGTDNGCIACPAGETSPPGASDSSECVDSFMNPGEAALPVALCGPLRQHASRQACPCCRSDS
jgi:hypothetical protein